ncbi:transmembrane protein, putative [Medicago truncatula]|uniref:Transmembrane protein, putative n=1 Tax=Medicago truncatula TaxID=3880 RepID=G7INX8_MEDTR|nr:transmembrane protein, putative [Medicago truncatula]
MDIPIDYSIKDLGVNVADPEVMDIPVTLILLYIPFGPYYKKKNQKTSKSMQLLISITF